MSTATGAWAAERLLDLVVLMILLGASVLLLDGVSDQVRNVGLLWLAVFVSVYVSATLFSGRGRDWLVEQIESRAKAKGQRRWHRVLSNLATGMACLNRPATNAGGLTLTLAIWMCLGAGYWAYLSSYFPTLPYPVAVYTLILINLSGLLNLSPGNVGIHQMTGIIALQVADIPASDALVALVGLQAVNLVFIAVYAVVCRALLFRMEAGIARREGGLPDTRRAGNETPRP